MRFVKQLKPFVRSTSLNSEPTTPLLGVESPSPDVAFRLIALVAMCPAGAVPIRPQSL
jgi:hypothetical protein